MAIVSVDNISLQADSQS